MKHLNVEIKARSTNPKLVKTMLEMQQADYRGLDTQTDTYYTVPEGRLKMREGRIENALIFYISITLLFYFKGKGNNV